MNDLITIARILNTVMICNCDLDNWAPAHEIGHSHVCRIHKQVKKMSNDQRRKLLDDNIHNTAIGLVIKGIENEFGSVKLERGQLYTPSGGAIKRAVDIAEAEKRPIIL